MGKIFRSLFVDVPETRIHKTELGVLVASLYSKKQNASKWILGWTWPTFGDFKAGTVSFPSFIQDLSIKEHLLEAMARITRARKKEVIAKLLVFAVTLILCVVYFLKWENVADFVNSLHDTHSNSNSTESYQDPFFNSSGATALARGSSAGSRPSCHEQCEDLYGEEKELCLERCYVKGIVAIVLVLIFFLGGVLGIYPARFLAQRAIKGIIEEIHKKIQDQGLALEWVDDYHPVPICYIHQRGKFRWILSGINLRVNVSVRKRYCEANGRPFDAEIYNTPMVNPDPEGEFERDYDVYIGARCQDGQENTHPLMDPPPYSNTEV